MAEKKEEKKEKPIAPKKEEKAKEVPKKEKVKKKDKKAMLDALEIIKYPHLTEKSINNIETQNKLVFVTKRNAKKSEVKKAIESAFDVKVEKVNSMITTKGTKKVIVRLADEYSAADVATKLGMM